MDLNNAVFVMVVYLSLNFWYDYTTDWAGLQVKICTKIKKFIVHFDEQNFLALEGSEC